MKSFLKNLAYAVLVLGAIGSIVMAYQFGNVLAFHGANISYERDWPRTIGIFGGFLIGILVVYAILMGISELLEKQADCDEKVPAAHQLPCPFIHEGVVSFTALLRNGFSI